MRASSSPKLLLTSGFAALLATEGNGPLFCQLTENKWLLRNESLGDESVHACSPSSPPSALTQGSLG